SSKDGAQSWTGVGNAISLPLYGNTFGTSDAIGLALDGANLLAFISFGMAVYNGQEWVERPGNRGLPIGLTINTCIHRGGTALVGTSGGVYAQLSDGQSWTVGSSGMTATSVATLAVSGDSILACDVSGGLFRSTNDGQGWTRVGGLDNGAGRPFR